MWFGSIASARPKDPQKWLRLLGKAALAFVVVIVFGVAYNGLASLHYRAAYPPPGQFYVVDGYKMHLYCQGSGSPAVVMEGGIGANWLTWQKVQPPLAKVTRVCSYDRAGLGWSDPRPDEHDAVATASHLHQLLQQAGINGPLVLMGQSAGGLYVREYAAKYPQSVAGLILVDATPPESFERIPGTRTSAAERRKLERETFWQHLETVAGFSRILGDCRGNAPQGLSEYAGWFKAQACKPSFSAGSLPEFEDFEESGEEVAQAGPFGNLPILIISQDPARPKPGWSAQDIAANPIWNSLQESLKGLSTRSCRIIAKTSGHQIQLERPDVIVTAVEKMILELRSDAITPVACGTTAIL